MAKIKNIIAFPKYLKYNANVRWADTLKNPKELPDECAGSWQAAKNLWLHYRSNVPAAGGQHEISH